VPRELDEECGNANKLQEAQAKAIETYLSNLSVVLLDGFKKRNEVNCRPMEWRFVLASQVLLLAVFGRYSKI